jgi:hypothetical protein
MAHRHLTELPAATNPLDVADLLHVNQSLTDKKITAADIATWFLHRVVALGAATTPDVAEVFHVGGAVTDSKITAAALAAWIMKVSPSAPTFGIETGDVTISGSPAHDQSIVGNPTSVDVVWSLPAATCKETLLLIKGNATVYKVTINRAGSDVIGLGSATSVILSSQGDFVILRADGVSRWYILESKINQTVTTAGTTVLPVIPFKSKTVIVNCASPVTLDATAGADSPGTQLSITNKGAGACTVQLFTGVSTLILAQNQSIVVEWDGTYWFKIGGSKFRTVFTSGTGATWAVPFKGSYDVIAVGGGGGAGGAKNTSSGLAATAGGGGGGYCKKIYHAAPGATFTYTVGLGGAGGSNTPTDGVAGGNSTVTDGVTLLTAPGGPNSDLYSNSAAYGSSVSKDTTTPTGGDINIPGSPGKMAVYAGASAPVGFRGEGGASQLGVGGWGFAASTAGDGAAGKQYGGGGGGTFVSALAKAGGAGADGVIIIEF